MEFDGWTRDLLIFLVVAGIVVPVFYRARVGTVLAFLIIGVALGPGGLGSLDEQVPWLRHITFVDEERVEPFAQLGVMFLLFTIGLDLSLTRLWSMRRLVFGAGTLQTVAATIVIGGGAMVVGLDLGAAIVFGLGLAFSSTAIVLQLLIKDRRLGSHVGQASLGILLMQDLLVVPGVILVTILAGDGSESVPLALAKGIGVAAACVIVILFVGRLALRPLLALAASTGSREIVLAIGLLVAIGGAMITSAAGLSPALGAFLGGLLLGASEYRHQVEIDIEPFKGLLLGIFFMSVGMSIDVAFVVGELVWILAAVLAFLAVKAIIVFAVLRAFGVAAAGAIETGFLLAGAGEFAFVLFTLARQEGLMTSADLRFVTTVAAISMMLTPLMGVVGKQVAQRWARAAEVKKDALTPEEEELSDHVVLTGYGRVGEIVAHALEESGMPYVALDLDARRVAAARAAGRPVHFGDGSRREMLDRVGGERARAFVVTSDLPAETDRTVAAIREAWPESRIFARARDVAHARRLAEHGVAGAVPEAFEGSLTLAERVLITLGVDGTIVDRSIETTRGRAMSATEANGAPPAA